MKTTVWVFFLICLWNKVYSQVGGDSLTDNKERVVAEDPSQFITRVEATNELQKFDNEEFLNISILRSVIKIGKRFTTRIEIPFIYNSISFGDYKTFGLSDINFRLLGYRIYQSRKTAIALSLEASLNTAQSPLLGTGKNILIPMVSLTRVLKEKRMLLAIAVQQANAIGGDEARRDIRFTKVQIVLLNFWTRKMWTVLSPETFVDYVQGGVSMNLEGRMTFAPAPKINLWLKGGVGLFGDFAARYKWSVELGARHFFKARKQ